MITKMMLALALAVPTVATAGTNQPQGNPPKLEVSFADLDLTTPEGEAALDRRIHAAARVLCADLGIVGALEDAARLRCIRNAVQGAKPQVAIAVQTARGQRMLAAR